MIKISIERNTNKNGELTYIPYCVIDGQLEITLAEIASILVLLAKGAYAPVVAAELTKDLSKQQQDTVYKIMKTFMNSDTTQSSILDTAKKPIVDPDQPPVDTEVFDDLDEDLEEEND